jgi:hypothetical protein
MHLRLLRCVVAMQLCLLLAGALLPTPVSYASNTFNLTPTDEPTRPPATSAPTDPPATSAPTNVATDPPTTSAPTNPPATSAPTRPKRDDDDDDDDDQQSARPVDDGSSQIPLVPVQQGTPLPTTEPTPEPTGAATPPVPVPTQPTQPTSAATPAAATAVPSAASAPPPPAASSGSPNSLPRTGDNQHTPGALPLLLLACIAIATSVVLRRRGAR